MAPESTQFTPIELGDRSRRQPNDPSQFNAVNHNAIPRNFPSSLPLLGKKVHNPGKTQTANIQDSTVEDKGRHQARILLLVASALYASELSFVAKLNESVPVGISLVLRFGLASISVLPLLFYDDGSAGRFLMARRGRFCWKTEKVGLDMGMEDGTRINAVTASSECDDEDVISCNKSVTISVQSDVTPLIESRDDENVLPVSSSSNILRENQERLTDVDCRCLASSTSFKVTPLKKLFITGLEIGFYNGIGLTMNSLLLSGKIATASELAFVGSLSTVFVPLLEYAFIPFFDSIVRNCIVENNSKNVGDGTAIAKRMKWSQKCGIVMAIVGLGLLEGPFGSVEHGHGVPIGVTHLDAVILQRKSVWDQLGFNLAGSVTLKPSLHFGNFSIVPVSTIEHYPSEAKVTSFNLIDRNSPKKSLSMEPSNHISHGPPTTQGYNNQRYSDDGSFLSTSVNNGGAILSVDGPQDSELFVKTLSGDVDNMKVESEGEKSLGESWRNNNDDEFSPDTSWDLNGDDAQPPFEDDLDMSQDRGKTIGGNDANSFSSEEEEPLYPRNSLKDRGSSWGWSNLRKLICIAPPICFALGFYKIEQAMEKYPAAAKPITAAHIIGIFVITIICYFFSTITGVDILPVDNANSTDEFKKITFSQIASWLATPAILFQLLWSGIASIVIGIYLESLAMKTLTASESVVIFSTEPIFASAFASWFCGELFLGGSIIGALGAFSIVAGCIISELGCEFIGTGTKHLQSITACRRNYLGKLSRKKNDVVCNEDIGDNSSVNQMLSLPWNEEVTICMEMKQYSASNAVPVELNTPLFIGAGPTRLRRALKDALPDNADASDMEKRA